MDGVRRALDPRPDILRRTGGNTSGLLTRGGRGLDRPATKENFCGGTGGLYKYSFGPFPYPRQRRHTSARAVNPKHLHGARRARTWTRGPFPRTTRTGGHGPGRHFQKTLCVTLAKPAYFPSSCRNFEGAPDTFGHYRDGMAGANGWATAGRCWTENMPFNAQQRPRGHAPNENKKSWPDLLTKWIS